ncbi:MAG: coproporphyrinogen III oxidase family protein [bacterium]
MLIENFITWFMGRKNAQYLRFQVDQDIDVPHNTRDKKYLLYIHIPFCRKLCPYCSFNRYTFEESLARSYFGALREELKMYYHKGYTFTGVYIGGGTPTILMDELDRTLALTHQLFPVREVSVETNPDHVTGENLKALKGMKVNRLSVGVQSFDDSILRSVDRYEKYGSGQEIQERIRLALGNFDTLNIDMIFNFPHQTIRMLEKDLDILLNLHVDQVTFYPLMVSTSTQKAISQQFGRVDYQQEKDFYFKILERLSGQFSPATAWCFSKAGDMIDEYIITYDEYAGVGSGAFGYLNGCIYANTFSLGQYIKEIQQGRLPLMAQKIFSVKEQMRYDFLMKLFGGFLDLEELKAKFQEDPYRYLWMEMLFFKLLHGIRTEARSLHLTQKGQYYWVIMMREFFIGVNNFRDYCRSKITDHPPCN